MAHTRDLQNRHTQWWYNSCASATRAFLLVPILESGTMKNTLFAFVTAAALVVGCVGFEHTSNITTPTSAAASAALAGSWQSVQDVSGSIIPDPNTCTGFTWTAISQTATTAAGMFSATCNGVVFSGAANGTLTTTVSATWAANGAATGSGLPQSPCAITLTGTAQLNGNTITVPYTGNTCVGPVSGTQVLNKK
jgi:hypothetical protein